MEIERMSTPQDEGKSNASNSLNPPNEDAFVAVVTYAQGIISSAKLNQEAIQKLLDATRQATENQEAVDKALSQKIEAQIYVHENAFELHMKAIDEATRALTSCASNGARIGVTEAISSARQQALGVFHQALTPDLSGLKNVVLDIGEAKNELKTASRYLTWKAVGLYALVALVPLLVLFVWDKHLLQKIETEQTTIKDLNESGGKMKITRCGDDHRLCVQIDTIAGSFNVAGQKGDYRIIKGY